MSGNQIDQRATRLNTTSDCVMEQATGCVKRQKEKTMITRQEHVEWCKKRAYEYLAKGDVQNAVTSMMSDMQKHEETALKSPTLAMLGMLAVQSGDMNQARRFIDGFN